MKSIHKIQFPKRNAKEFAQDEVFFYLIDESESKSKKKIRFHDYDELYKRKGLYEQLFYDRLKCKSPEKIINILKSSIAQAQENFNELRVLDLGAGNGIVGQEFKKYGVSRLVGVDIIPEAFNAVERDRPEVYDYFYITDFCNLNKKQKNEIQSWSFDCLTCVAALGFGDIPTKAFTEAFNIINSQGWVAFNIKETFLDRSDTSGFSSIIRELIFSDCLDLYHLERYRHRLSIEGKPIYYFAVSGKKNNDIPKKTLKSFGLI